MSRAALCLVTLLGSLSPSWGMSWLFGPRDKCEYVVDADLSALLGGGAEFGKGSGDELCGICNKVIDHLNAKAADLEAHFNDEKHGVRSFALLMENSVRKGVKSVKRKLRAAGVAPNDVSLRMLDEVLAEVMHKRDQMEMLSLLTPDAGPTVNYFLKMFQRGSSLLSWAYDRCIEFHPDNVGLCDADHPIMLLGDFLTQRLFGDNAHRLKPAMIRTLHWGYQRFLTFSVFSEEETGSPLLADKWRSQMQLIRPCDDLYGPHHADFGKCQKLLGSLAASGHNNHPFCRQIQYIQQTGFCYSPDTGCCRGITPSACLALRRGSPFLIDDHFTRENCIETTVACADIGIDMPPAINGGYSRDDPDHIPELMCNLAVAHATFG